jgi:hypothetical protein
MNILFNVETNTVETVGLPRVWRAPVPTPPQNN